MKRLGKAIVAVVASVALVLPLLVASENKAQGSAMAATWSLERYGSFLSQQDAQRAANAVNSGDASDWRGAYVGRAEYVGTTGTGARIYSWPVFAYHHTN